MFWGRRVCGGVSSFSGGVTVWVFWGRRVCGGVSSISGGGHGVGGLMRFVLFSATNHFSAVRRVN